MNSSKKLDDIRARLSDKQSLSIVRLIIGRVLSSRRVSKAAKKSFIHAKSLLSSDKEYDSSAILDEIQKYTDEPVILDIFDLGLAEFSSKHSSIVFTSKDTNFIAANTSQGKDYSQNGNHIKFTELILSRQLKQEERESLSELYKMLNGDLEKYLDAIANSEEVRAKNKKTLTPALPHLSDAEFILYAFLATLGRYPTPQELYSWSYEALNISYTREEAFHVISKSFSPLRVENSMVLEAFGRNKIIGSQGVISNHASIMGTTEICNVDEWNKKKANLSNHSSKRDNYDISNNFFSSSEPAKAERISLSIITSLYNGDPFIKGFLENIVNQKSFSNFELIIIDACSPGSEKQVVDMYKKKYSNIVYHRCDERISIYDAWNLGVNMARGDYLTNANLDDLRSPKGLSTQVAVLDRLSNIDIVYGDFLYFFEENPSWELVERIGIKSSLSLVSKGMLLTQNYPHCAPLWRKGLHSELGYFDTAYKSAADWEFWLRCINAGKKFYHIPLLLSAYYHNPSGISTAADSRGIEEVADIYRRYYSNLILSGDPDLLLDEKSFNLKHPSNSEECLSRRAKVLQSFIERLAMDRTHQPEKFFANLY